MFTRDIKFDPLTPDTKIDPLGNDGLTTAAEMRRALKAIYARQQQMEAELASTRAALENAEADRLSRGSAADRTEEVSVSVLMKTLMEALTATSRSNLTPGGEASGPRDWKPPS